ncbi:MAG TPA: RT0821/Lpp0805 family surface protein [Alphaproteobacteria bacterium]|nr:RT0821/Lpp0805 family surface protein [Alphaproteobacteria bacterium]
MKIKLASIASALVLSVAIGAGGASPAAAACAAGNPGAREVIGSIGGAVIGGLIGSRIGSGAGRGAAIAGGVLVGGLIGNRIGNALDCEDVRRHNETTNGALERQPDHTTSRWENPNTGAHGNTTPTQTYTNDRGRSCRRFTTTVTTKAGQTETGNGTACRNAQGGWDIT